MMNEQEYEKKFRNKIYQDLHTPVLNRLLGLAMRVEVVLKYQNDPNNLRFELARLDAELRKVIATIRTLVKTPYDEQDSDVLESISGEQVRNDFEEEFEWYRENYEIDIIFRAANLEQLTGNQVIILHDLLGNWLDNVAIHAKPRDIFVNLRTNDDREPSFFILRVTDNGQGNEKLNNLEEYINEISSKRAGLRIIMNCVRSLGADYSINSTLLGGTTLTVTGIPIIIQQ